MPTSHMPSVPFLDLRQQNASLWDELQAAIARVAEAGQFILGPAVERFEEAFARYVNARYCIGLNNGTLALHMALLALDIGPGDEVITTPHTWISTSWAISYVGATPVYVDIDPDTYTLAPEGVAEAITNRTRAILPVHLYGQAADLAPLRELADAHAFALIEDAAQAHGAIYRGRKVGSIGDAGCFSFYPGKNLGAFGEGGAVVTNDERIAQRIRRLRDHAQERRHHHVEIGFNTRMEGIQGAVLETKLPHLDDWNNRRRRHASELRKLLADVPDLTLPACREPEAHVWHLYVVLTRNLSRELLQRQLSERGISAGVHYPTLVPFQPAYAHLGYRPGDLPVAEKVAAQCLSLPMFPELTGEQLKYVSDVLHDCCESLRSSGETDGVFPLRKSA